MSARSRLRHFSWFREGEAATGEAKWQQRGDGLVCSELVDFFFFSVLRDSFELI
jgi:hypothetical protein